MKTLEENWAEFQQRVFKGRLSEHELFIAKLCFGAGTAIAFDAISTISELDEDVGVEELERWRKNMLATALQGSLSQSIVPNKRN